MEETFDQPEVIETQVSAEETVETPSQPEVQAETPDQLIARLQAEKQELEDKNRKLYARVKEKPQELPYDGKLTSGDLLAVTNAKIHEDDIEKVERFAKAEGISIKEALRTPEVQSLRDLWEEQRKTAGAANMGNVRRGSAVIPDEVLLANARAGKLPETDYEIERLIAAKRKG